MKKHYSNEFRIISLKFSPALSEKSLKKHKDNAGQYFSHSLKQ